MKPGEVGSLLDSFGVVLQSHYLEMQTWRHGVEARCACGKHLTSTGGAYNEQLYSVDIWVAHVLDVCMNKEGTA